MSTMRLPTGFHECALGEVVTLKRGYDLPQRNRRDGDIPIISSSGITGYHNEAKARGPGVVTGRYGTLGEVFYVEQDFWPLNTALYAHDLHGNDPRYVACLLRTLGLGRQNSAGAVPGVNRNALHPMRVVVPEPELQERIADVLTLYDQFIAANERRMALLEESAHLLYREWFQRLRFPGHEWTSVADDLPDGWQRGTAGDVITFNERISVKAGEEAPFVPMSSLGTVHMTIEPVETRIPNGGARFRNGDTLLARITPCLENGKTGFVQFLVDNDSVATGSTEFIVMRGLRVPATWVYCLARSEPFRQYAISHLTGSDGRQRVSADALALYPILIPSASVLDEWARITNPRFEAVHVFARQNAKLREARDYLLPRLLSGQITV